ncbi:NAD(P)H-binding protein [Weeksella virosa]|nr:NAD(P)H-binding protein [Weeksella virosa]
MSPECSIIKEIDVSLGLYFIKQKTMNALIIGATGATGKELVQQLLEHPAYSSITIFVRKNTFKVHPKLTVHCIDFSKPEKWQQWVVGDVLFSALGTTLKKAGSKKNQWTIDFDYQYTFARIAKENKVPKYVLVSASRANENSIFFYSKMKGKLEKAVEQLKFEQCIIVRPPLLVRPNSDRKGENLAVYVLQFINRIGLLQKQKPLPTYRLAQAMLTVAQKKWPAVHVIEAHEIEAILREV